MNDDEDDALEGKRRERVIVKGYMRPDGTSYYVVIPKEIREMLGLKGGEYFVMKAKKEKREIELKVVKFVEEGQP
jgi:AbrB family looped-hinge helix DNA binding protein